MELHIVKRRFRRESGIATLMIAVILMLAGFGIAYFTSEIVLDDRRIVSNKTRADQAFQAAEAGLELGKAALTAPFASSATLSSGSSFDMSIVKSGNLYVVESKGTSDDGSIERTLKFAFAANPATSAPPNVPVISRGGVSRNGGITAINNQENLTIWAGSEINPNNSATSTYISIDEIPNQLSSKRQGKDVSYGPDIVENDPNLANLTEEEDLLRAFFGKDLDDFEAIGQSLTDTDDNLVTLDQTSGGVFYSSGNVSLNSPRADVLDEIRYSSWEGANGPIEENLNLLLASLGSANNLATGIVNTLPSASIRYIGSPDSPVTIVADGTIDIPANVMIFGVVVGRKVTSNGSATIVGGVIAYGNASDAVDMGGTVDVVMDKTVMANTGAGGGFGPVLGSWRDW